MMVESNEIKLAPILSSDSPGVQITTVKLNGANHFLWPKVVKVILGARLKLKFSRSIPPSKSASE